MSRHADELIARHITLGPEALGPLDARIAGAGVHVWALIAFLRANGDDVDLAAADYELPREAVEAAHAYYRRHRDLFDARLALHWSSFAPAL